MSEAAENLEALNNAELRAKCKQFGLPNVPVTDSSRKILIKKLRVSMGGGGVTAAPTTSAVQKKPQNRRETIHAAKLYPSIVDVEQTTEIVDKEDATLNRSLGRVQNRRTIAAPHVTKDKEQPAPIAARRRSMLEQEQQRAAPKIFASTQPTVIVESESDDEIEVDQQLAIAAEQAEQANRTAIAAAASSARAAESRSSRSVSLTKSGIVTTTYRNDENLVSLPERDDMEIRNSIMDALNDKKSSIATKYSSSAYSSSNTKTQSNVAQTFPTEPPIAAYSQQPSRRTIGSSSTRYSTATSPDYYSPSLRRSTIVTSSLRPNPISTSYAYNEQSDDTEGIADDLSSTPYLSSFARNLERIKAEPLGGRITPGSLFGSGNRQENEYAMRHYKRSKMHQAGTNQQDGSLRQLLMAMERKYHLKRNFILLLVVLMIVFLFVVFWQ